MQSNLKSFLPEYPHLWAILFIMGWLVVWFNVTGYDILFTAEPWFSFFPVSPFGVLLGCAEIAVLIWTSAVIREWQSTSRILKVLIFVLVPSFGFLCYSGINSYLLSLATADIQKVHEVKFLTSNNSEYIRVRQTESDSLQQQLILLRQEQVKLNKQINKKNNLINELGQKASDRRLGALDCTANIDCANSVAAFENQAKFVSLDIGSINSSRQRNDVRIGKLEDQIDIIQNEIRLQKLSDKNSKNELAGVESTYSLKKAAYENIILTVTSWFNWKPNDPFSIFISFISFLIYPVYFMLNLFLALNSTENKKIRSDKRAKNIQKKDLKNKAMIERNGYLKKLSKYIRTWVLRKKRIAIFNFNHKAEIKKLEKSHRSRLYKKLLRYFKVWAHRRTKTRKIELIKEVEIKVEVEKMVETVKEIEIEKIIEVAVEVDRIVKVPTEIPVYIEKIKKVPEPVFITEPQIIIHERLVFVPENITAAELEEIFNAQPRLNESLRVGEGKVNGQDHRERSKTTERTENTQDDTSSGNIENIGCGDSRTALATGT